MKLFFSWWLFEGQFSPICQSDVVNGDGVSPLCCLLTDDGGQKFLDTISWLNVGLNKIDLIMNSVSGLDDWSRDAWGAELSNSQVKIYSLHDENYFELIDINSFKNALSSWKIFIQSGPDTSNTEVVEL